MGTPTFLSIIIPVYKVEPYLRECLNSIAASDQNCWEAILIDDGSPDGCPQICDEYAAKDKRFCVIHQENAGVAVARNAGLDVAQGQWCWFVDSDDVVDMRPVGDMVTWLQGHKEVDLVMFDLETFKDSLPLTVDGLQFTVDRLPTDVAVDKNEFLMKHVCYHHQRLWYHRRGWRYDSTINEDGTTVERQREPIRFSQGIRVAEDLEFQYKYLTLCQHPVKINNRLYCYREREGSATQNDTYRMKVVEDLQIVLNNLAEWIRKYNVKPEAWLDFRIMKLFQNLLYSASLAQGLDTKKFQAVVRNSLASYRRLHFPFVTKLKYKLADIDVRLYFLLNRAFLRCKRLISD